MKKNSTSLFLVPALAILFLAVLNTNAQIPVLTVRFANPRYTAPTQVYSLDVEFKSNTPNQKLYGMNVRLFYDDVILEYQSMTNFIPGYAAVAPLPALVTTSSASGGAALFGFPSGHPFEFCNGAIQKTGTTSQYISTTGWTRIFTINFHVDDAASINIPSFCPSVIWDLEYNPSNGGWLNGDDGVVMTVVGIPPAFSSPTTENVVQHNWQYNTSGMPYGVPVSTNCISTIPFVASVSSPTTAVCAGSTNGSATATATGGTPPYTYAWNTSPVATTATISALAAGSYTVTVTDAASNTATATTTIASNPLPVVYNVTGSGAYCANTSGKEIGLNNSQSGTNYTMMPGNLTVPGTGSAINFGVQPAGTYTVAATTTTTGCASSMSGSAIVTVTQPLPVSVDIVPSTTSPIATDEAISITATPTNGGDSPAYQWKVNGINTGANNAVFTFEPANGDVVNCILTSSLVCVTGNPATSNTVTIQVQAVPQTIMVTGTITTGVSNCYNATQEVTVAGTGAPFTVQNGGIAVMVAGQKITFLPGTKVLAGGYLHGYIATNNEYCGQQAPSMATVTSDTGSEINSEPKSSFRIYPNPATDQFTVSNTSAMPGNEVAIMVMDMKGNTLFTENISGENNHRFDISSIPAGLYVIHLIADGKAETSKLIKLR